MFAFMFPQNVVMRLFLEHRRFKTVAKMGSQKSACFLLIAVLTHAYPEQMNMIRHHAVDGTQEFVARANMNKQLPKRIVSVFAQPSRPALRYGVSPVKKDSPR